MKITGKDGKEYESVDACLEADKAFDEQQEAKALAETEKKNALSKEKKEMADAIKKADEDVSFALAEYEKAKEEARNIISKAKEEAKEIIQKAEENYKNMSNIRYNAIKEFNDKFGVYTTSYTGHKALEEYNRIVKTMDRWIDNFFGFPFIW